MRNIEKIYRVKDTIEGAGVKLKRGFGYFEVPQFDPFLLFDDFSSELEEDYIRGFPMHPHRGIETVTYIKKGEVRHKDSLGNEGSIKGGEIQWMTAGSGIVHEEMPQKSDDGLQGFQLWVNLPKEDKMMSPRYQEIKSNEIPLVEEQEALVKVIAGTFAETKGPVTDLMINPTYLDIELNARASFTYKTVADDNYFIYVYSGRLAIRDGRSEQWAGEGDVALLTHDNMIECTGGKDGAQFLLIGGTPIGEAVAWRGPIVMNTETELDVAFAEYQTNTFIK